jgi:Flp pilus assembly protein TadD
MVCTWFQTRHWKNTSALFTHAVNVTTDNYVAHYSLGLALGREGKIEESMKHSYEALRIKPDYAEAHNNLGVALAKQGRVKEAVEHFSEALRINPDYDKARENLEKARLIMKRKGLILDGTSN